MRAGAPGNWQCGACGWAVDFVRYLAVSVAALGTDLGVFAWIVKHDGDAALAATAGYLTGLAAHYVLSSRLAFRDRLKGRGFGAETPVMTIFLVTGLAGLGVTYLTVMLLSDFVGLEPILAKTFAVALSFIAVFLARRLLALKPASSAIA
jgi:putative flippase GtrA